MPRAKKVKEEIPAKDKEETTGNTGNEDKQEAEEQQQRVISDPKDVATLALAQLNQVNVKKDELTIAIKGLSDLTSKLVNVYASNMNTIQKLVERVKELEAGQDNKN